jgi:outer membrane protein OmpA-like peptidoglycan-associated protein
VAGGDQFFRDKGIHKFDNSLLVSVRFDENLADYFGLEESLTAGFNELELLPYNENSYQGFSERNYQLAINPLIYLTKPESRVRPFLTVGADYVWWVPSAPQPFEEKNGPGLVYGAGFKLKLTDNVAFRFDARGLWAKESHFGLPDFGTNPGDLYIPKGGTEKGVQLTAGFDFGFGHHAPPPPPPAPAPPPPPPPVNIQVGGIEGAHDVCPGEDERLTVSASGWPAAATPTYQWMVDGQPVDGATGTSFSLPTAGASGTKSVTVKVTAGDASGTSSPVSVRIKDYHAPTVQFSVSPTTVTAGGKAQLTATASGSECGGATSIQYAASEGTISGDTYDSSGVQFDMSNRSKEQTKVVHLTATATDARGGTGSATADLNVTLNPEARRLDDIVFPAGSARVNNCGKRLLLEELTPMLRDDPNATVILIGHRDTSEKGRKAAKLDEERVINTAAVLSAGTGICPQLELSRVKVNWVGTDQTSTPRPSLCGESTNVKEKSGQAIKASDKRAEYRRVEVWFVPGGAEVPAGLTGLKDAPAAEIKAKGCPK